jgi:Integrase zinc binding domain
MSIKEYTGRIARYSLLLQEYTFDIEYKKGQMHSNADAISRPPIDENTISDQRLKPEQLFLNINTDQVIDNLEPYDNESLIYYLRNGKYKSGSSNKNVKKIEKLIKHYILDGDTLKYRSDINTLEYRIVPFKDDRRTIVLAAHAKGHFNERTVYDELVKEYYWPKMRNLVSFICKSCLSCQRNNEFHPIEHPAKAIPIRGLFDTICMDLRFGLNETRDGYKGTLIIVEYLSKFIRLYPIKSKSADEVKNALWNYICTYGPPKTILNDLR